MNFKQYNDFIISMEYFIEGYVLVEEQIDFLKKATHKDIKFLNFNNVKAVPFELISKDSVFTGEILLVKDIKNNIVPYLNPLRMNDIKKKERKML